MSTPTKHRILIVEDESMVARATEHLLRRLGYEVLGIVDNGEEAVRQTFALSPDLVLVDVKLRGEMEGTEAARQIRIATGRPVVLATAHSDEETLRRAKESDVYGYILKPFGERDLFIQLEMALHRYQLETERTRWRREQEIAREKLDSLRGLLALCAGCKKVSEENGRWTSLEDFLAKNARIDVTHSFCPDCETRLYGTQSRVTQSESPKRR